jgi:hypothetical protein
MELSRRQMQEAINARAAEHAEKMKEASLYHSTHSPVYTNLRNILYTCTFFISYSNGLMATSPGPGYSHVFSKSNFSFLRFMEKWEVV